MPINVQSASHPPMQQGKFDRLCGVYSFVNAALLADPTTQHLSQRLFDSGLEFLSKKNRLQSVMKNGMSRKLWLKLGRHILAEKNRMSCKQLEFFPLSSLTSECGILTWERVADCTNKGWPVLVHLRGAYNHFSVVSQVTAGRIVLFDSDGQKWVQRRSCHIGEADAAKRFSISPASLVALRSVTTRF